MKELCVLFVAMCKDRNWGIRNLELGIKGIMYREFHGEKNKRRTAALDPD